jgi:hypothetical protein
VRQPRREPSLVEEHLDHLGTIRHVREESFDDHELAETRETMVNGEVDFSHSSLSEARDQRVFFEPNRLDRKPRLNDPRSVVGHRKRRWV